jgi:hypothetical protein
MKIMTPKDDLNNLQDKSFKVFLAGSMGSPWRAELISKLEDLTNLIIIDPSVDDWDKSVGKEDVDNAKYVKQVDWEHKGLGESDVQVFYFDASSVAPISLLELGMFKTNNTVLCVKDGYEKSGYLAFLSRRFGLPNEESTTGLASLIHLKYHTLAK